MSKIMFIGDVHLSPRTPLSRKDDYPQTLLNKLDSIKELAVTNKVTDLIFLGDLFNTKHMTLPYFIKSFEKFQSIKNENINLHLIVGNHDITYNNDETLKESPIQLLYTSQVFERHNCTVPLQFDKTDIYLYDYTTTTDLISQPQDTSKFNILVGHYFYMFDFSDELHSLTKEQCTQLNYDAYILGHDHSPYDVVSTKDYQVHRPGSLSRGTSQSCQLHRDKIQVIIYDTDKPDKFDYIDLPKVLPNTEIYKEDHLINKISLSNISDSLQDLLADLTFDNSSDIFETLHTIPMDDKIKELITQYLNAEGIYDLKGGT